MTHSADLLARFRQAGGLPCVPDADLRDRAHRVGALLLDWDGVFNPGTKGGGAVSGYSEPDSMGLNLLRFGYYLRTGRLLPVAILTGADNPAATEFARRERLYALYSQVRDKSQALLHVSQSLALAPETFACLFDDLNDLPMARGCGFRVLVRRPAAPLFEDFARKGGFVDYRTGQASGQYPIREACELMLGLWEVYDRACHERIQLSESYRAYWEQRQAQPLVRYEWKEGTFAVLDEARER